MVRMNLNSRGPWKSAVRVRQTCFDAKPLSVPEVFYLEVSCFGGFSPILYGRIFSKIDHEVKMGFSHDAWKLERNSLVDFGENSTQSFDQWSR